MLRTEIDSIVKKMVEAREAYYNTGTSIMSDQEYDALEATIAQHDPLNPVLEKVGHTPSSAWEKGRHQIPMGSLEKCHTEADVRKWAKKYKDQKFIMQLKLDGLSVSLDYENEAFKRALVRGDGVEGEDISDNVRLMKNFKNTLEDSGPSISVRAEMIIGKEDFERINLSLPEKDRYSNPRNAASGISRRLDGKYCKYIQLIFYDINEPAVNEDKKLEILEFFGLPIPSPHKIGDLETIISAFEKFKTIRSSLPFDIDGVVIKVCSNAVQEVEGSVRNRPKAQRAWKFEPPGAITTLLKVTWDVGRTGIITPRAWVEPVEIEGSVIKKSTLHNIAQIKKLSIGIGDMIMIVKAGDIIPFVTKVVDPIYICPECNFKGSLKQQEEYHVKK
jgi:DNA ligase (NAD+)